MEAMTGWRLLLTGPGEPGFNMAVDEALGVAVRRGWSPPTLRIFSWAQPAISLGCHQPLTVLEAFGVAPGMAVVRRPTAGGAVLHGRDVSYALACPSDLLRGAPSRTLYRAFHEALGRLLTVQRGRRQYHLAKGPSHAAPETAVCFQQPIADDLMRGTTKVAGAAQRRWRDGLLQQGTVIEPSRSADRLALNIRAAWASVFGCRWTVGTLTVSERVLADELWSKYRPWMPSSSPLASRRAFSR